MPSLNHTPNLSETKAGVTKTYTYDASDRLIRITSTANGSETEIARYAYAPMGRRIAKTIEGHTTYFLYTEEGLIAELNGQGNINKAYGWVADTSYSTSPLWQAEPQAGEATITDLKQAQFHTLTTDHLGTVQMATNEAGEVTWKAQSEAFGQTTPDEKNQITMNLRFPGQYFDEETGTHYNYFRDYNPSIGRYIQRDPIGLEGEVNVYQYANANALQYIDPTGEFVPFWLAGVVVGALVDIAFEVVEGYVCDDICIDAVDVLEFGVAGTLGAGTADFGKFEKKPRTGIAGGGKSGDGTSKFSKRLYKDYNARKEDINRRYGKKSDKAQQLIKKITVREKKMRKLGKVVAQKIIPGANTAFVTVKFVRIVKCVF